MKRPIYLLFIFSLFIFSCGSDDVADLTTTTVSVDIEQQIPVILSESDPKNFGSTVVFDASADPAVANFGSRIDSYELKKITLEVKNYSSTAPNSVVLNNASLEFVGTGVTLTMDPLDLAAASTVGPINLNIDAAVLETLSNEFQTNNKLTVDMEAMVSDVPVQFTLEVIVEVDVTGSIL